MITEHDLQEAIAECEGQRNPAASTCVKLAAFYVVKDKLYPSQEAYPSYQKPALAYTEAAEADGGNLIHYDSGTELSRLVDGRAVGDVLPVFDELMEALMAVNPRLYDFTVRKLKQM